VADYTAGLQVISVANPANPAWVGAYDTAGSANAVAVSGSYAYVADCDAGLQVINISNPANPVRVGGYNTSGYARDVVISGGYAYVADYNAGLQVISVANPANPAWVGACDTGRVAQGVADSGEYSYGACRDGLQVVDIGNPANPLWVSGYDTSGFALDVVCSAGRAYVADDRAGLQVIDVTNPADPVRVGGYDTSGLAVELAVLGNYVYMADYYCGLCILAVGDGAPPSVPTVWPAAAYSTQTKLLVISAVAFDPATGTYVTAGPASYDVAPLPYAGSLSYNGSTWVAQVNMSSNPPPTGQHAVEVTIAGGSATTPFSVGTATGTINGAVRDVDAVPITGAEVRLYTSTSFYSSNPQILGSFTTGPSGTYTFSSLSPGTYVVSADASGYTPLHQSVTVAGGHVVTLNLVLSNAASLAQLKSAMQSLCDRTLDAMDAETLLIPELTEQAADDLNAELDAWDVAEAIGDILSSAASMGPDALGWFV